MNNTNEQKTTNINCVEGCSHNCRYCYGRLSAVERFKRMNREDRKNMQVREGEVEKGRGKRKNLVRFPSTHDITPEVLEPCLTVLGKLIDAGNEVIIVSKPHKESIEAICEKFQAHRQHLRFRFSIGAMDNTLLAYWEPGAPTFEERLKSLKLAQAQGFETKMQIDPMFDPEHAVNLFYALEPYVTGDIQIGGARKIRSWVRPQNDDEELKKEELCAQLTDEKLLPIYQALKDEPKVRWTKEYDKVAEISMRMLQTYQQ